MSGDPAWVDELVTKFRGGIAHTFILHGAIDDYIDASRTQLEVHLAKLFARRTVIFYNTARGITIDNPDKRAAALRALGRDPDMHPEHEPLLPSPREALPALEQLMLHPSFKGQVALVFQYPELIWPQAGFGSLSGADRQNLAILRRWATGHEFRRDSPAIIMLTGADTDLHASLRTVSAGVESIEIPYPDYSERLAFIHQLIANGLATLSRDLRPEVFAALSGGLQRTMIEDIAMRAEIDEQPIGLAHIRERKTQIVRQEFGELLEIIDPEFGFNAVGGMAEIKQYLARSVIAPLGNPDLVNRMPAGVLLAGPPGTGKTMLVSALAREAGCSCVKMNVGRLLGQYVGASERNLEKALACIRSLVPVIVLIDEIDQQVQRGSGGDSGVERRIFGRILEEMSASRRGEVIWFGATNRVENVDAALRRPGRFDRVVPILPPAHEERLSVLAAKAPGLTLTQQSAAVIAQRTDGYTGADLEGVIVKAREIAFDDGQRRALTGEDIIHALSVLRPAHGGADVQRMTDEALLHCNDLSLVPAQWREKALELEAQALAKTVAGSVG